MGKNRIELGRYIQNSYRKGELIEVRRVPGVTDRRVLHDTKRYARFDYFDDPTDGSAERKRLAVRYVDKMDRRIDLVNPESTRKLSLLEKARFYTGLYSM